MAILAKDIANALGISPTTVSMVFNNHPGISDETREKVLKAAADMGYTKHLEKSAGSQVKHIQLILYKRHGNVVADTPFFAMLTQGIDAQVKKRGYQLLITYFYQNESIPEQIRSLQATNCAGIILLATEMHTVDLWPFEKLSIPIVILDNCFPFKNYDSIQINNIQGARLAVQHLIDCGHTEIGYLSSRVEIRNFRERMEGYLKAIRTISVPNHSSKRIIKIAPTTEEAFTDMEAYLSSTSGPMPTAFFADNDIIAAACMRALKRAGYRIPEDISLVGFDNVPICEALDPPLSTIDVPKSTLGKLAVNQLVSLINGETDGVTTKIEVSTGLVKRDSVRTLHPGKPAVSARA